MKTKIYEITPEPNCRELVAQCRMTMLRESGLFDGRPYSDFDFKCGLKYKNPLAIADEIKLCNDEWIALVVPPVISSEKNQVYMIKATAELVEYLRNVKTESFEALKAFVEK